MQYQFKGFKCTKPKVVFLHEEKSHYQVQFFIYPPAGGKVPYRYSKGINSEHIVNRHAMAETAAEGFWIALKDGWNPLTEKYPSFEIQRKELEKLTFGTALEKALTIKKDSLSKWSYPDYKGTLRFMKKAAGECTLLHAPVQSIKRKDIRLIIATAKEQNDWSNHARNKYLTLLKSLLTVLVDEELLEFNPAHKIKNEKSAKGSGYRLMTDHEHEKVVNYLYENYPDYFEYCITIEDLLIRRKELLMIQVKDINLNYRHISITEEVAKSNTQRKVPITDGFLDILLRREFHKLPQDWYIFSSNNFAPGPGMFHPNTPTNWWRKIVIKGLGINSKLYSLKHRGADQKILAGIGINALKEICGHKSIQMTEIYAQEIKKVYAKEIIDKSPSLTAKIIPMKKAQ